jgi:hypothetical protein
MFARAKMTMMNATATTITRDRPRGVGIRTAMAEA